MAPDRAGAPEKQHAEQKAKQAEAEIVGRSDAHISAVEAASDPGQRRADDEREQANAGLRHATRDCVEFVIAHRDNGAAIARPSHEVQDRRGRDEYQEGHVVVADLAVVVEPIAEQLEHRQTDHPRRPTRDVRLADNDLIEDLRGGDRDQDDVNARQSHDRQCDQRSDQTGGDAAHENAEPGRETER